MSPRILGTVISVIAVGAGCGAIYVSNQNASLDAYNSAPACRSLEDAEAGKDCRMTEAATITQIRSDRDTLDISFAFPNGYVPSSPASLPAGVSPSWSFEVGERVPVELWGYRVTKIAGSATADNPVNDPGPLNLRITGVVLAVLGVATAIVLLVWRRLPTSSPGMGPVGVSDALWR